MPKLKVLLHNELDIRILINLLSSQWLKFMVSTHSKDWAILI